PKLVEQPGVLDGDDGLRSEVLDQFNLLCRERPDFLTVDADRADQIAFLDHRNNKYRSGAGRFGEPDKSWLSFNESCFLCDVRYVLQLLGFDHASKRILRTRLDYRDPLPQLRIFPWRAIHSRYLKSASVVNQKIAEFCFANPASVLQHCLKHRR